MDIIILALVALMAVMSAVVLMARISLKRFLGYPNAIDVTFSTFFVLTFHGTFAGMVVAGFACFALARQLPLQQRDPRLAGRGLPGSTPPQ